MDWPKLLSTKRIRELIGAGSSLRSPGDPRTEFERDYGRCIFSTPVRRLQDKAQIFPLIQHDAVRTRLTHSVEVSSVARGLATEIGRWLCNEKKLPVDSAQAIETIAATCAMIHDLGNPPFGHAGEQAISDWFTKNFKGEEVFGKGSTLAMDFIRWEGNAQTIRLISRLQVLADEYGLNLTCGTFSAASKYVAPAHKMDLTKHEWRKPGYFASEAETVARVRAEVGTGEARNPITYIVEAADDIVYCTVDLEDGIRKRLFPWKKLEQELQENAPNCGQLETALKLAKKKTGDSVPESMRDDALMQYFRAYAINGLAVSVIDEFKRRYEAIMEGDYHGELTRDCSASPMFKACKAFLKKVVYNCDEILRLELLGRRVICDLLTIFWEGASTCSGVVDAGTFANKAYLLMSDNYRLVFERALEETVKHEKSIPELYCRIQLVCDYVAGMTDTFASTLHKRLVNG
jgi:dGTPase